MSDFQRTKVLTTGSKNITFHRTELEIKEGIETIEPGAFVFSEKGGLINCTVKLPRSLADAENLPAAGVSKIVSEQATEGSKSFTFIISAKDIVEYGRYIYKNESNEPASINNSVFGFHGTVLGPQGKGEQPDMLVAAYGEQVVKIPRQELMKKMKLDENQAASFNLRAFINYCVEKNLIKIPKEADLNKHPKMSQVQSIANIDQTKI